MPTPPKPGSVKERYGFLPTSVLYFKKSLMYTRAINDNSEVRAATTSKTQQGTATEFNPDLAGFCMQYWSEKGDTILDPFMGRVTRPFMARHLKRNYIGFDVASSSVDFVNKIINKRKLIGYDTTTKIVLGDGCKLKGIADESVDMVFTCPPYYDREVYEEGDNQLSRLPTYREFLKEMKGCFKRCYATLKPGKFLVIVVGNWREKGEYINFADDIKRLLRSAGFVQHDEILHKLKSLTQMNVGTYEPHHFVAKVHEYVLVFKKPEED